MNPELWPFRVGVRLYKAPSQRREESDIVRQPGSEGEREYQNGQGQRSQFQHQKSFPPGSEEYSRNKKRQQYKSVGGWQVPNNAVIPSVNEQSLLEALKALLSGSP